MRVKRIRMGSARTWDSLEAYAVSQLDGDDYGRGALEAATATAENNSAAIGKLLEHLADKELIEMHQIAEIVGDYGADHLFFEGVEL